MSSEKCLSGSPNQLIIQINPIVRAKNLAIHDILTGGNAFANFTQFVSDNGELNVCNSVENALKDNTIPQFHRMETISDLAVCSNFR